MKNNSKHLQSLVFKIKLKDKTIFIFDISNKPDH